MSILHWLVWRDPKRRAVNLLRFAEVEADGGRDLVRAAEVTRDPVLPPKTWMPMAPPPVKEFWIIP